MNRRTATAILAPLVVALGAMVAAYAGLGAGVCFDVAWTSAAIAATGGTALAWRHAHPANRDRWRLWTIACACWLFGQLAWDLFGIIGFPQSPNIADLGWWAFALLAMASMVRLARGPRPVRIVAAIESLQLVAAALALCFGEQWSWVGRSSLALAPKLAALAYPAFYVSATVLTIQAVLAGSLSGVRNRAPRLVLAGVGVQAIAFIMWSNQLLEQSYVPGHSLLDPLWVAGLAAIALGGLLAARRPEPVAASGEPGDRGVILPSGMFLILFLALVGSRLTHGPEGGNVTLEIGLTLSGAALIARSIVLGRRLKTMLNRERTALASLAEREAELARINEQLVDDSRRDPLTGIGNRRAFTDDLSLLDSLPLEEREPIALALCDVDHFKSYNDRFGHLAGDQALRMLAATVRGALRAGDAAYRFGGEELLLVLRNVTAAEAGEAAERIRAAVQRAGFPHPDGEGGLLTVSIGVAAGEEESGRLLARADSALYEAKRSGRNRTVTAAQDDDAPTSHARPCPEPHAEPAPRHLRSMLAVTRAAAAANGPLPVVRALAETIRSELFFQVVAVNLAEEGSDDLRVVVVLGDEEARSALEGSSNSLGEWQRLLALGEDINGASWLAAGSYEWETAAPVWTPRAVATLSSDAWHPEDMLLLPLRSAAGELRGVISVDQPTLGRRPSEADIGVLMAVVDHAGLMLDRSGGPVGGVPDRSGELRLAAVMLLAETLDLRDPSTALHSRTVGRLARATANEMGLPLDRVERIHAAGVLHDLGKLGVADAILFKPGPLDDAEWREMRRHPDVGARILEHAGMHDIADWVRAHHERVDGRGYPAGLSAEQISLEARILAVADAYEAMTADRPYRAGMPPEDARTELRACAGSQFDPVVVDAFIRALASDSLAMPVPALT